MLFAVMPPSFLFAFWLASEQSLSCLSSLAPRCLEDYMGCQGNTRILLLVEACMKDEDAVSSGCSFAMLLIFRDKSSVCVGVCVCIWYVHVGRGQCHSTQPCHNRSVLQSCLTLLLAVCDTGDEALLQDLHEQGIIPILTS